MKTKNKFKKPDIQYDPIKQEKQPFWMQSVESCRTKRSLSTIDILGLIAIFGIFGLMLIVWG